MNFVSEERRQVIRQRNHKKWNKANYLELEDM